MPIKSEQPQNCKIAVHRNIGRCLKTLTADGVLEAIRSINEDPSVHEAIASFREYLLIQESEEEDDYVYWIDYCQEVDCTYLKTRYAAPMTRFELMEGDAHFALLTLTCLLAFFLFKDYLAEFL